MRIQTKEKHTMNTKLNLCCLLAAVVLIAGCESAEHEGHEKANLQAEAKITEAQARATVMAKVPDATIKEAELEKEKGKLIWSFDIAKPNAEGISEINVDAITGAIVGVEKQDKD
jgi:uncharacterized membrane protein YkoI